MLLTYMVLLCVNGYLTIISNLKTENVCLEETLNTHTLI